MNKPVKKTKALLAYINKVKNWNGSWSKYYTWEEIAISPVESVLPEWYKNYQVNILGREDIDHKYLITAPSFKTYKKKKPYQSIFKNNWYEKQMKPRRIINPEKCNPEMGVLV